MEFTAAHFIPPSEKFRGGHASILDDDYGVVHPRWPKPGDRFTVRLLLQFCDGQRPWLLQVDHWWFGVRVRCTRLTHGALVVPRDCPICEAILAQPPTPPDNCKSITTEVSYVVYGLILGNDKHPYAGAFCINQCYHDDLVNIVESGAFDFDGGCWIDLEFTRYRLKFRKGARQPIDQAALGEATPLLSYHRHAQNHVIADEVAKAYLAQRKCDYDQPSYGQSSGLRRVLPGCTLLPILFGLKRPIWKEWQQTPFEVMLSPDHLEKLDNGNVGCMCGFDRAAHEKGLVPYGCVVGLDGDLADFAAAVVAANPWLKRTFAVKGKRGCKWFFRIVADDLSPYVKSCKIYDHKGNEVGDWLADGKQGVVAGLHPDGLIYDRVQPLPMLTVPASEFKLPEGYYLSAKGADELSEASRKDVRGNRSPYTSLLKRIHALTGGAQNCEHSSLKLSLLEDVCETAKGWQARCPACAEIGDDTAGDNLLIYSNNGAYSCSHYINCAPEEIREHNRRIWELVGKKKQPQKRR